MKILLVEDEEHLARGLTFNLERQGYAIEWVRSGEDALDRYGESDLMLLDIGLPGIDGFEVLRTVRAEDERFPVLLLTARAAEDDVVQGLSLGADDYITKPFSLQALMLKVQHKFKQVRWYSPVRQRGVQRLGKVEVDLDRGVALSEEGERALTAREVALVAYFLDHPNRVIGRDELLQRVWGYQPGTASRTVDTFIARLRKLVEPEPLEPRYLISARGQGYLLKVD